MRRIVLAATLAVAVTVGAQPRTTELDRAAAAIAGSEAGFTHSFTPKGFKNSQVESGSVVFGQLPAMRWMYARPEAKVFVFDGTTSWFYVPADRQVTVGRVDDATKRELPFLLLGDPAAREKAFAVKEEKRGGTITTTLRPRDPSALVRNVAVLTDAATHRILRIDYSDREGNRTTFQFSGYHPRSASADTFRFSPPPGVQIIDAE